MKRRRFLQHGLMSLSAYLVTPGGALAAPSELTGVQHGRISFAEGVASADPWPDSVVLWTRAKPEHTVPKVTVLLQISEQETFDEVLIEESLVALATEDFTLRITVAELSPDQIYFYRFRSSDADSPTGRTRTAPAPTADRHARFALMSCQNYELGYFTAYRHLAARELERGSDGELDFILHVGDFIYESQYHAGVRPFAAGGPAHAESLEDYRYLYRTYLSDPDLQSARARWPFVCTWDDHEFSNDSWQHHSVYGADDKPEAKRHHAARQAWLEYVPARAAWAENELSIYRDLRWGRHAHLIVTDSRSYRSDHALPEMQAAGFVPYPRAILPLDLVNTLDAGRLANDGNPPDKVQYGPREIVNNRRTNEPGSVLGQQQKAWLKERLTKSDAAWKLCACSIPMLPIRFDYNPLGETIADQYIASADGWDGYPTERRELLDYVREQHVGGFVSLTGDLHMHFSGVLTPDFDDRRTTTAVGVEFACASVSSSSTLEVMAQVSGHNRLVRAPAITGSGVSAEDDQAVLNLTLLYGKAMAEQATGVTAQAPDLSLKHRRNRHLRYLDTGSYGYVVITCEAGALQAANVAIEPPRHDDMPRTIYVADISVPRWQPSDGPEMSAPVYSGIPPYPFN